MIGTALLTTSDACAQATVLNTAGQTRRMGNGPTAKDYEYAIKALGSVDAPGQPPNKRIHWDISVKIEYKNPTPQQINPLAQETFSGWGSQPWVTSFYTVKALGNDPPGASEDFVIKVTGTWTDTDGGGGTTPAVSVDYTVNY